MTTITDRERPSVAKVVELLEQNAAAGVYVLTAKTVWRALQQHPSEVVKTIRVGADAGLLAIRRVRSGGNQRRTYLALPQYGHHLPAPGGAR